MFHLLKIIGIPCVTFLLGFSFASSKFLSKTLPITENLIPLNSTEGEELLFTSNAKQDYLPLSVHFVAQKNPAFCGVASLVMVLNALKISAIASPEHGNSHVFTQTNVFNQQMRQVLSPTRISFQGMSLEQLGQLLETYPVKAEVHHASDLTSDQFRQLAVKNLQEANNFVLINYLRKSIGQQTWGHISPLAAYDQKTDRFLILDVSRDKYPPVWVKTSELWQAMATTDSSTQKTRADRVTIPSKA